jgi:hypothetical protein
MTRVTRIFFVTRMTRMTRMFLLLSVELINVLLFVVIIE